MTEAALWKEVEEGGEQEDFACAMLLKQRGHKALPFRILDGSTPEHEARLLWVRGLRALRDRRTLGPLMLVLKHTDEILEKKVIMTALRAVIDLGGPPHGWRIPPHLLDSEDGDVAGLALMAHLMDES